MKEKLRRWFQKNRRDFAFRDQKNPYKVWVSEVMLQQTRLEVVLPYFSKWMKQFPDVHTLAKASKEEVIKCWEGLGYYSRARNLHRGAQEIVDKYQGFLPSNLTDLLRVPGIGPYTARAILSFAFHQKVAPVDGNVIRIITRLFAIDGYIESAHVQKTIQSSADSLLEEKDPHEIAEGLIELGQVICKKSQPRCHQCPLKVSCKAYKKGTQESYPKKRRREAAIFLEKTLLALVYKDQILIKKSTRGLMKDLYEFPTLEGRQSEIEVKKKLGIEKTFVAKLPKSIATYTKYKVDLYPYVFHLDKPIAMQGFTYISIDQLHNFPFPSGHRRVLSPLLHLLHKSLSCKVDG